MNPIPAAPHAVSIRVFARLLFEFTLPTSPSCKSRLRISSYNAQLFSQTLESEERDQKVVVFSASNFLRIFLSNWKEGSWAKFFCHSRTGYITIRLFTEFCSEIPGGSVFYFFPSTFSFLYLLPVLLNRIFSKSLAPAGEFPATLISSALDLKESFLLFSVYHSVFLDDTSISFQPSLPSFHQDERRRSDLWCSYRHAGATPGQARALTASRPLQIKEFRSQRSHLCT